MTIVAGVWNIALVIFPLSVLPVAPDPQVVLSGH
jgi:hypothetical protein